MPIINTENRVKTGRTRLAADQDALETRADNEGAEPEERVERGNAARPLQQSRLRKRAALEQHALQENPDSLPAASYPAEREPPAENPRDPAIRPVKPSKPAY